ncbi:MAG: type II toxin-antitoxin system VapC family toxin [Candidatus Electrothrix aestuarii]|uniref:Ribonuclease VapC n=1 Tax=Candidatus Electrothrix aestuarii TaxID=3062594 RepID=A0AAU8LV42_9BACT|nr:type II toxin-antitoxin system VapC family toxin [Candidatus Electrothrix aestuarii]
MSGERLLLDTNAVVALLQGDVRLVRLLRQAEWIGISVISRIEFLVFSGLTESDRWLFQQFLQRVEVVELAADDTALTEQIIAVRQQYRLKLPDAVIAAMAIQKDAALVTADRGFSKMADNLTVINWT